MPHRFKGPISQRYSRTYRRNGRRDANLFLIDVAERMPSTVAVRLAGSNDELVSYASRRADHFGRLANRVGDHAYRVLSEEINAIGLKAPEADGKHITEAGAVARMIDPLWWRRALRRGYGRQVEQTARTIGLVHKSAGIYSSDETVWRRREQKSRNRRMLEEIQAVNELGESFTLAELAELSVSNPIIRRGELMVRMSGFERVADELGHVGEFVTLTAPSRFHSHTLRYSKKRNRWYAVENPAFDGSTPRDAKNYLQKVWQRIRAKLARHSITLYGFRVAEPHHDGCPHWHMLVFMPAWARRRVRGVFIRYGLFGDTPGEPGAFKHRVTFKAIDKARGSATGYIAKYIAKNIDGFALDDDLLGGDPIEAADRVDAWASCWGIRQFQQLGGPPVTVWRELRRLDHEEAGMLEQCRAAADGSDWAGFVTAMGGPSCPREARPVKAFRLQDVAPSLVDMTTGEGFGLSAVRNKYGEPSPGRVIGVACGEYVAVTRWHKWSVDRGDVRESSCECASWIWGVVRVPDSRGRNLVFDEHGIRVEGAGNGRGLGWGALREATADPWSSVDNCTRGSDESEIRAIEKRPCEPSAGGAVSKNGTGGRGGRAGGDSGRGYRRPTAPD